MAFQSRPERQNIYMGADVPLTTLENGAISNADAQERSAKTSYLKPEVDRVASGVYVFGGDGFLNLTLIEGDDGLIVYDTGEVIDDGQRFFKQIRSISNKPIVAVIYSHSHYVHGTQALIGDGKGIAIIGHPALNANLATGGSGSLYAETAPLQVSRTLQQFNHYSPRTGPNAAAGANIHFGRSGTLPVNTPVEDGQRMTVAGIEMQFFTRYGSDTDDCLTVLLTKSGVVLNNFLWPFIPNIYTLRGAKFRDPREWRDGLKVIRDLDPFALVNTHARAIVGRAEALAALDGVIDGLDAILDQSLRGMLRGLGPDELRAFVRLPAHLQQVPNLAQIYGELSHFGPYLFNAALGWFDGDAATINPLPPAEQAERLVDAMGGRDKVLSRAQAALEAKEFAWSAQLAGYLFKLDPGDREARTLKAGALEAMGRVTPAFTVRSWYMAQALALRGEARIPHLTFTGLRILANAPPAESIDHYRVRIDPDKSADLDLVVSLEITDRSATHAWHLRRGVVEFIADVRKCRRAPDLALASDYENWLRFFCCKKDLGAFLESAAIRSGSSQIARDFFGAFDVYAPGDNAIIPFQTKEPQ